MKYKGIVIADFIGFDDTFTMAGNAKPVKSGSRGDVQVGFNNKDLGSLTKEAELNNF